MSSFQINGQDPPAGGIPKQSGYGFILPGPVASDAIGRPVKNDNDEPRLELTFSRLNKTSWNWYCSFLASHRMYGILTSIRTLNPYQYTVAGGPEWVTFTGDNIVLNKPKYGAIEFGNFFDVTIEVRGLE